MRVKCFVQENKTITWPVLEPGPLDPESSVLTTRPLHLPHYTREKYRKKWTVKYLNMQKCSTSVSNLFHYRFSQDWRLSCYG